jgi:hypothetical protein
MIVHVLYFPFRGFLLNNFSYDEKVAIDLLLDHYMMEQLFELAKVSMQHLQHNNYIK